MLPFSLLFLPPFPLKALPAASEALPDTPRLSQLPLRPSQLPLNPFQPPLRLSQLTAKFTQLPLRPSWMTVAHLTASETFSVSETPEALLSPSRSYLSLIRSSHCIITYSALRHCTDDVLDLTNAKFETQVIRGPKEANKRGSDVAEMRGPRGPTGAQR